jgi:Fe(3+) dicitrate transport protein
LPVTVVYTYTDAHFENSFESTFEDWGSVESGDAFPYLANHQLTGIIGFSYKKFNANISGNYMSAIRMAPGQGEIPSDELIEDRTIFDFSLQYQAHQYISLFASALNFTDAVYVAAGRPAGLRPGMPRTMNVGVKMNF